VETHFFTPEKCHNIRLKNFRSGFHTKLPNVFRECSSTTAIGFDKIDAPSTTAQNLKSKRTASGTDIDSFCVADPGLKYIGYRPTNTPKGRTKIIGTTGYP